MKVNIQYPTAKCKWCGKPFQKQHNRQTYCSKECRKEARREQNRNHQLRHYHKYKKKIHQKRKGTATIGPTPNPDMEREQQIVENEIRRIGLTLF